MILVLRKSVNLSLFCFNRSTKRFGPDGKRFEHLAFLNFAQNVVCLIWSYISKFCILHEICKLSFKLCMQASVTSKIGILKILIKALIRIFFWICFLENSDKSLVHKK